MSDNSRIQRKTLLAVCLAYASFYLCRMNLAVVLPSVMEAVKITKSEAGLMTSVYFATYTCGQFINGYLGDRFQPRKMIALGLFGSAVCNIMFVSLQSYPFMILFWGLNAYFQSMGWGPSMKLVSNKYVKEELGRASGIMGIGYQAAHTVSWLSPDLLWHISDGSSRFMSRPCC